MSQFVNVLNVNKYNNSSSKLETRYYYKLNSNSYQQEKIFQPSVDSVKHINIRF